MLLWLELEKVDEKKRSRSKILRQNKKLSFNEKNADDSRSEEKALHNSRKNYTKRTDKKILQAKK